VNAARQIVAPTEPARLALEDVQRAHERRQRERLPAGLQIHTAECVQRLGLDGGSGCSGGQNLNCPRRVSLRGRDVTRFELELRQMLKRICERPCRGRGALSGCDGLQLEPSRLFAMPKSLFRGAEQVERGHSIHIVRGDLVEDRQTPPQIGHGRRSIPRFERELSEVVQRNDGRGTLWRDTRLDREGRLVVRSGGRHVVPIHRHIADVVEARRDEERFRRELLSNLERPPVQFFRGLEIPAIFLDVAEIIERCRDVKAVCRQFLGQLEIAPLIVLRRNQIAATTHHDPEIVEFCATIHVPGAIRSMIASARR